jgi:hypothetical protein
MTSPTPLAHRTREHQYFPAVPRPMFAANPVALIGPDSAAQRTRPQVATIAARLALSSDRPDTARVDAGGTRLRLRALHVMGHDCTRIARAAGTSPATLRAVIRGHTATVTAGLREAVITIYDAWWDKRAPTSTRAERAAATRARRRAIRGNWCAAAALDDDELDIPGYQPAFGWRPALGTGVAADLHLIRACQRQDRKDTA